MSRGLELGKLKEIGVSKSEFGKFVEFSNSECKANSVNSFIPTQRGHTLYVGDIQSIMFPFEHCGLRVCIAYSLVCGI